MLKLKAVRYEALASLLYVADQNENVYVMVDRGKHFDYINKPRYRLHTCSLVGGEIRRLIEEPWELIKGAENSTFTTGLRGNANDGAGGNNIGKNPGIQR